MSLTWKLRLFRSVPVLAGCAAVMLSQGRGLAQGTGEAGKTLALMPLPSSMTPGDGALVVTPAGGASSTFTYRFGQTHDPRLEAATRRAIVRLNRSCGGDILRYTVDHPALETAVLTINVAAPGAAVQALDEDESYQLNVTPQAATLTSANDLGAMHGLETLLQMVTTEHGACVLPAARIDDRPRFRWRGFMLDVSRHFEPVPVLERQLDGMAAAKLNVFHWHLSDDEGFRAESKRYPKLTATASEGQFYTQDEIRGVVAYARARGIRVIPEFDMPGHSSSWVLAYPELSVDAHLKILPVVYGEPRAALDPTSESTYKFLDAFVGEMGSLFPDDYFHIGGDEVEGKIWTDNPRIAEYMKKKGFNKADELQAYFNQRLEVIVKKHHKKVIGWDEILNPALPKTIVIQSWRGEESLARGAADGYEGILSAPYYLDAQKTSAQMYLADPLPADTKLTAEQQKLILGGEICMWAEQLNAETVDSRVWPRTLAIAERFWSPQSDRDVPDMYRRLRVNSLKLEDVGLRHLSGPAALRRNLVQRRDPEALEVFASVLEPVSFGDRSDAQNTGGYTALDRLVDAVAADPPSRQQIATEVAVLAGDVALPVPTDPKLQVDLSGDVAAGTLPSRETAARELRRRFLSWQAVVPDLLDDASRTPRLNDVAPRAEQLNDLAEAGLSSLTYLEARTAPPAGWKEQQLAVLDRATQPAALVRFTFLPSLRRLVLAAAEAPKRPAE